MVEKMKDIYLQLLGAIQFSTESNNTVKDQKRFSAQCNKNKWGLPR